MFAIIWHEWPERAPEGEVLRIPASVVFAGSWMVLGGILGSVKKRFCRVDRRGHAAYYSKWLVWLELVGPKTR